MKITKFIAACDYVLNILMPVKEPVKPPPVLLVERLKDGSFDMTLIRDGVPVTRNGFGYNATYKRLLAELEELEAG